MERGHGIDFNGPQNTYKLEDNTTFIYEEGSIKKLTDKANPMKQAFRIPDDFLIPGKTVGLIESGWHDDATNNVLQTWFVGKGHPGECLSIPLNLEKFSLKNGEYYLVSIIPDDKLKQETGQRVSIVPKIFAGLFVKNIIYANFVFKFVPGIRYKIKRGTYSFQIKTENFGG